MSSFLAGGLKGDGQWVNVNAALSKPVWQVVPMNFDGIEFGRVTAVNMSDDSIFASCTFLFFDETIVIVVEGHHR